MNCLISGAGGYIGSALCPLLLELGHHVTAVDLDLSSLVMCCESERFEPVKTDILNADIMPGLLAKADAVVHLAAIVGAAQVDANPAEAKRVMLTGVHALTEWAKDRPIIIPNTDSGYGAAKSLYAQLKIEGEKNILDHGGVSLRLGSVFGPAPRMRHTTLLNFMVREAVTKGFLALSQPNARRTLLHVEDCALAIIHALGHYKDMAGQAYDVAIPRAWTKGELSAEIAYATNFVCQVDETVYLDPDERDFEPDTGKLAALGFRAMNGVASGIRELVRVYKCL